MLIRPSPTLTGSISTSTRLMRGSRNENETRSGKPIRRSGGRHMSSCTAVPATTPIA